MTHNNQSEIIYSRLNKRKSIDSPMHAKQIRCRNLYCRLIYRSSCGCLNTVVLLKSNCILSNDVTAWLIIFHSVQMIFRLNFVEPAGACKITYSSNFIWCSRNRTKCEGSMASLSKRSDFTAPGLAYWSKPVDVSPVNNGRLLSWDRVGRFLVWRTEQLDII